MEYRYLLTHHCLRITLQNKSIQNTDIETKVLKGKIRTQKKDNVPSYQKFEKMYANVICDINMSMHVYYVFRILFAYYVNIIISYERK